MRRSTFFLRLASVGREERYGLFSTQSFVVNTARVQSDHHGAITGGLLSVVLGPVYVQLRITTLLARNPAEYCSSPP